MKQYTKPEVELVTFEIKTEIANLYDTSNPGSGGDLD